MSARAWKARRRDKRARAALRKVWRYHASVRRIYPVKTEWLDLAPRERAMAEVAREGLRFTNHGENVK